MSGIAGLICLIAAAVSAGDVFETRVVQLDLARQMETVPFIKRYLKFAKDSGYNAVQLYLEGRIRTKSFPFRGEKETYSPEEIREIAAEAERVGIDLVPVVSVLGHAEHFVNCPELEDVCEESRAKRTRFEHLTRKETFCHSTPKTREFLERYLDEVIELFPGKNFHVGLDESFNTGFCPECSAKMKTIGLGGIYLDVIRWAHGYLAKKGRRMWMWGDFFEFFPEKMKDLPKDVLVCDWEYSSVISRNRGHRGCFGDRYRNDWVRKFRELGVESVICPAHEQQPMDGYCDYGISAGAVGASFVQWEMSDMFHGRHMVLARAAGLRWSRGIDAMSYDESLEESVKSLCPTLDVNRRNAVVSLVKGSRGAAAELAIETLKPVSAPAVAEDPFSESAIIDDLITHAEEVLLAGKLDGAESALRGIYRRSPAIRSAKQRAAGIKDEAAKLRVRRQAQEAKWRPGCRPNRLTAYATSLMDRADGLAAASESEAADDEWQLELSFVLPDFHGIPNWKVEGCFDGLWKVLAEDNWKPVDGEAAYYERTVPFVSPVAPSALRISYHGYNDAGLAFVSVASRRSGTLAPRAVTSETGRVRDAKNLLVDTVDAAYFGNPDCRAAMLDPALADEVSQVVVEFGPASKSARNEIAKFDPNMDLKSVVTDGMKWIDGKLLPIEGREFNDTDHYYDRLPANVTTNVNNGVRAMKHHTAGMQFRFTTDSDKLIFKWVPYERSLSMDHMPSSGVSGIDVYRLDAESGKWFYVKTGRIWDAVKGGTLELDWTPNTPCLVNLPLYNGVKSFSLGVKPEAKVAALPPRKSGVTRPVVFYGTSITHGGCCSRPGLAFPSIVGRDLDVPIVNLGFSGCGRCELEMSEHLARIDASCYVIDTIWNMDERMIRERYEVFVRNLRRLRPETPIVLAEGCDVYCGTNPKAGIIKRNTYVKPLYDKLLAEGWKKLYFLPSKGQYAEDLEGAVDGVHPNDWGMKHLAVAFGRIVAQAIGLR